MTPRRDFGCWNSTRCDTKIHAVMVAPETPKSPMWAPFIHVVEQEGCLGRIHHHRSISIDGRQR